MQIKSIRKAYLCWQLFTHSDATAQPAAPADRFAREIGPILKHIGGALAAAERQDVGRCHQYATTTAVWYNPPIWYWYSIYP
jgi:hypothetical protein